MPIPAGVALAAELAPSVIGAIGSLFGAKQQSKSVQQANAMQLQIARENNSAQERMLMMNNAFNRQQAIDMFNLENAYNSPEHMRKLLVEGGYNPATMYQNGAQVARSDASTPQAASSGITPTMPNIQPVPSTVGAMFGNFETLSRVAANMASAGLSKAQTERISTLLGAEIDKLVADTQNAELENEWNNFKFSLDKLNLGRKQEQEIQELISKVWKNYADGGASHALVALHEMETRLSESKFKMNEEQRPILLENLKKLGNVYEAQVDTEKSIQSKNYAEADESRARRDLTREERQRLLDSHDAFVELQENRAKLSRQDLERAERTTSYFVEQLKNSALISQKEYELIQEQLEAARRNNDWATFEKVFDKVERINNGVNQWMPWAFGRSTTSSESGWSEYQGTYSRSSTIHSRGR